MKNKLIAYCKRKGELLNSLEYFTEEDEAEILMWEESVVSSIVSSLISQELATDSLSCPWCLRYPPGTGCHSCSYGNRHGVCGDVGVGNTYDAILVELNGIPFTDHISMDGIKELLSILK